MDTVLGLLGLVAYSVAVIALAAAVTWIVVKVSPAEKEDDRPKANEEPAAS